jgi:hypothetical protein
MKTKIALLLITAATAATSFASVSLQISLTTAGNGVLAGLQNSSGSQAALRWGIVVDVNGDGFLGSSALTPYDGGFTYTATTAIPLSSSSVLTDDVLYISSAAMASTTNANDGAAGQFRPTSISGIPFGGAVAAGKSFAVIWFDETALGGTAATGSFYGMVTTPTTADPAQALVLPADGATVNYSKNFLGAESARPAGLQFGVAVPEPSAAILGAVGALGLLRRRRN